MSAEEEHNGSNPWEFVGKVVNFLVLFGGLTYFLYKPVRTFLENRGREIKNTIKMTGESRDKAESELGAVQARLQELADEANKIRAESEAEGQKEQKEILISAKQEAERLKELTRQEIELRSRIGVRELKAYAVGLAAEKAREEISSRMTDKDHSFLIDRSIEKLGKLHEE
jgi:F-type H+-transporting ATPase subunit b